MKALKKGNLILKWWWEKRRVEKLTMTISPQISNAFKREDKIGNNTGWKMPNQWKISIFQLLYAVWTYALYPIHLFNL